MTLEDVTYNRSPPRTRPQSSTQMLATPPRTSMPSTTSNSSPSPRFPLGRSPQKTVAFAQVASEDEEGRASTDSAAIFSIYSMYGSAEGGSGSVPALPVGPGGRRESQGPSRLSVSYSASNIEENVVHPNAATQASQAVPSQYGTNGQIGHDQHGQARESLFHRHRQRPPQDRTSQVPAAFSLAPYDSTDSELRSTTGSSTTTAAHPSTYQFAGPVNGNHIPSPSSSSQHLRAPSDSDDDESVGFDVEFGSPQARMSFFSSSSKRSSKKGKRTTANSAVSNTELAYFDSGIMPSMPAPPRPPSAASAGTSRAPSAMSGVGAGLDPRGGLESQTTSYAGSANDDLSNPHGSQELNGKNNNRMSMSNWLPDPIPYTRASASIPLNVVEETWIPKDLNDEYTNDIRPNQTSLPHTQAVALSSQHPLECQPLLSLAPGVPPPHFSASPLQHNPQLHHTLSIASGHSHHSSRSASSSVYATPLTTVFPTAVTVGGTGKSDHHATGSVESATSMPVNNGSRLGYHTPSLNSRRGSPAPSLTPNHSAPPSAYQPSHQYHPQQPSHSNPGSRRQTPSPVPSRTGSLAAPSTQAPPSINYEHHSPHSSLSQQSTHSHHSYGASSVITKDTAVSAISATTATTSGSRMEPESVPPPVPMYHSYSQQASLSMLGRQASQASQASSQQHYASSNGHRSNGDMQIPRVDKDLPDMPRENGAASRASGYSNPGSRRPSPVPSLSVNGSPHLLNGTPAGIGARQSRIPPANGLSPSISQQSTTMTTTSGTSVSVSSTGATTANSSPDPNYRSVGPNGVNGTSPMHSPHGSLQAPHRSSSSARMRGNSPAPQQSPHQSLLNGPAGSIKAHSTPSLVPSVGEDLDAFHVRNTYAILEVHGVKGDGWEEGVERTRAARTRAASNISPSPSRGGADTSGSVEDGNSSNGHGKARRTKSQVLADEAIADENEKKRELDPKEIQILSSLDRYGFFNVPSHDRLLLLPSAPLTKALPFVPSAATSAIPGSPTSPTPSGSGNASATPRALSALPPVVTPPKESSRIAKWGRMLIPHERDEGGNVQAWRIRPSKTNKLRRRTYKGIPDRWRAAAWEVLMTAYSSANEESNGRGNEEAGDVLVETTLRQSSSASAASGGVREVKVLEKEYRECLDQPSTYDIQIDLDVPRTISGHIMFRTRYGAGQRSLFHVLHSFSLRCGTCGYVQGMGPITATLLSYMSPSLAYTSLVRLHDAYNLHSVFAPGFPGLLEAIYVQERLIQATMPAVYAAFQKHMISTTSYATKWYITLFANSVPFQTQLRFWDVFLLEGYDVYIAVALAVVWVYRDHITSAAANFETVLSLLSGFFVPEDENQLLGWVEKMLGDRRIRGAMRGWRKEWRELVKQGNEGSALL